MMKGEVEMSKLLRSITSSSARYGRSESYGRLGANERYESATPPFTFRIPRKLRIVRLGSRRASNNINQSNSHPQLGRSGKPVEQPASTFLGRLRLRYERLMLKAASKSGDFSAIPVAKASRAPPALSSAVSSWTVSSSFGSRVGTKITDLDPGFKMTSAEKKYLEHLKRSASSRTF